MPWPGTLSEFAEWRRLKAELQEQAVAIARQQAEAAATLAGPGPG